MAATSFRWLVISLWLAGLFAAPLHTLKGADITAEWIGVGSGYWADSLNWKDGLVPVQSPTDHYTVIINNAADPGYRQCSLPSDMDVYNLTLGSVLYVYDPATVAARQFHIWNEFHWLDGSLSGWNAVYHLHGNTSLEGNTYKTLDRQCSLRLYSNAIWTGGDLPWGGYGQVIIEPSGVLESRNGGYVGSPYTTDSASVSNAGTIRILAPGKTTRFYGAVSNTGLLDVQAGNVQFFSPYFGSGSIAITPAGKATFSGASSWQPFTFSGGGEMVLAGGVQILADTVFTGATRISSDLVGDGTATLQNAIWEGGQLSGPGALIIPAGGRLTAQNRGLRLSRTLINSGDVFFAPGVQIVSYGALTHTNNAGATIHLASAASATPGTILNAGTITKDDGVLGSATLSAVVQNAGTIRSTMGRLTLPSGVTNSGSLEALGTGAIQVQGLYCTNSSALLGDGSISFDGSLRGQVSSNLHLSLTAVEVFNTGFYSLRALNVGSWIRFQPSQGAEVRESFTLNGSLYGGVLRSLGQAELSFASAQVKGGSRLELLGPAAFVQGTLSLLETNSTLLSTGAVHVLGGCQLLINPGAAFTNQGPWTFNRQIGSVKAVLTSNLCSFVATSLSGELTLEDGPCQISGPVAAAPQRLLAGPGARLVLTDFASTNASVLLSQSSLEILTNLASSNTVFVLDLGAIIAPPTPWNGSATFTGAGAISANLTLQRLQLDAQPQTNDLALSGSLSFTGSNPLFQMTPTLSNGVPVFPFLRVTGPVTFAGRFDLVCSFLPAPANFVLGPVTLLESDQPIAGAFTNLTSGALVVASNGYRFRLFFGPDSPFGASKLVLTGFGSAFDQWRLARFSPAELNDLAISGPEADPDGNGYSNLAEFILAIDPVNHGTDFPAIYPRSDDYTVIHLRRRKDIGQLQATLGISSDLRTWLETPIGGSPGWVELHRVFALDDCFDYTYLYRGTPSALFLKLMAIGPL